MSIGIYKITNLINGHIYIGQSICIERRFREHKSSSTTVVDKAIKKYGVENFAFEIIEECSQEDLNNREMYWINYYDSYKTGYNCTTGGDGVSNALIKLTNDDVKKIYQLLLDYDFTQNEIAKKFNVSYQTISDINRGKTRVLPGYSFPLRQHNIQHELFIQTQLTPKETPLKIITLCEVCGKQVSKGAKMCLACCQINSRKVDRPDAYTLAKEICDTSFSAVGKKYGVTDNAIRKWCKNYNIPYRKKELKEWLNNQ